MNLSLFNNNASSVFNYEFMLFHNSYRFSCMENWFYKLCVTAVLKWTLNSSGGLNFMPTVYIHSALCASIALSGPFMPFYTQWISLLINNKQHFVFVFPQSVWSVKVGLSLTPIYPRMWLKDILNVEVHKPSR